MFSRDEAKKLRQEFWISFGKSFPRKWILYNTGIKDCSFKFHFDLKSAMVSMDIENQDLEKRLELWEKIISLQSLFKDEYLPEALFQDTVFLKNGKEISRVSVSLEHVSIHNKNTWQMTMEFLKENMAKFEDFFKEYEDIIRP
ncbi:MULTISPECIES: DUF4268 domain-containing protein [unclassified Arenibacter]|jgi:hypothetical protein|uniref:DUF4268 domain-containing protein n=1 Tax=unclassified Arenibacter TaxID=2615047 RepID=UPI000E3576E8|nr:MULTISPECIES: DUF4268 domain-containing protein [unclassified Arenibacter]MCM4165828.1 DUF4268 domain-containing protein [Arenibacter sp. A80]RFT54673.1 DUF4268 domain-containing protein [Arenibacter sp. P308M17]